MKPAKPTADDTPVMTEAEHEAWQRATLATLRERMGLDKPVTRDTHEEAARRKRATAQGLANYANKQRARGEAPPTKREKPPARPTKARKTKPR